MGDDIVHKRFTMISVITPVRATYQSEVMWLIDAVKSVTAQTYQDWEMVICNDHSDADMEPLREYLAELSDPRITGCKTEGKGVCDARNTAVRYSEGDLLLPLDADDVLPPTSMKSMMDVWNGKGIVYGDTLLFGTDFQRRYRSKPYSFRTLLGSLIMPIGSLHRREDWEKIGGWNPEMELGLEDWEYWIRMGKNGVCGQYIPKVTYHYRRRKAGRYMSLRGRNEYGEAYQTMRDIHKDVYNGRFPVGCCGSRAITRRKPSTTGSDSGSDSGVGVKVMYVGNREGTFRLVGKPTGTRYIVPGTGKLVINAENKSAQVDLRDAKRLIKIRRGRDFEIVS